MIDAGGTMLNTLGVAARSGTNRAGTRMRRPGIDGTLQASSSVFDTRKS